MSPLPSLLEIQRGFRRALLASDDAALADGIIEDDIASAMRIEIYRNNVLSSLTAALKDSFPAVCRLVDERFFAYAADCFVRAQPPRRPCLAEYGHDFPDFLSAFAPCRDLVYLGDVARLEWQIQLAASAADRPALQPAALAGIAAADAPRLIFRLQPSYAYLASRWPIDRIWRANRHDADADEHIDLESGRVRIELRKHVNAVELRHLDAGTFALRAALAAGAPLAVAAEAAVAADGSFDVAGALAALFADGAVIAFELAEGAS